MSKFSIRKLPAYIVLLVFDVVFLSFIGLLMVLGSPSLAYAYVDPSVMTYAIQAIAGVAVAIGATAGVAFRKTRKNIMKLLKIDENAGQAIDPFVERIDAGLDEAANVDFDATPRSRIDEQMHDPVGFHKRELQNEELSKKKRVIYALIVSLFTWGTLFFFAPVEIIISSSGDLLFTVGDLWLELFCAIVASVGVSTFVVALFKGKIFKLMLGLLLALGVCFWCQAMFMNGGLPTADGNSVKWNEYMFQMVGSLVAWLVIIAIGAIASLKWVNFKAGAVVVSLCLILVQFIGLISLFVPDSSDNTVESQASEAGYTESQLYINEAGKFTLSSKNNVIVFVLDTFSLQTADYLYTERHEIFDEFDGFTMYTNTTGIINPTRYAMPAILTGRTIQEDETYDYYLENQWDNSSFLEALNDVNYQTGIYSTVISKTWAYGNVMNVSSERPEYIIKEKKAIKAIVKLSCARDLPWVLKRFFWYNTDTIGTGVLVKDSKSNPDVTPNDLGTAYFLKRLNQWGLTIDDEDADYEGAFRLIHLMGAHKPYTLTAKGETSSEGVTTLEEQAEGSIYVVSQYLRMLKETGLYDDATIIVMADHGYRNAYNEKKGLTKKQVRTASPLFMMKPSAGSEYSRVGQSINTSDVPISLIDFRATVIDAITGDGSDLGASVLGANDYSRVRSTMWNHKTDGIDTNITEFQVSGDVSNPNNWTYLREWNRSGLMFSWKRRW